VLSILFAFPEYKEGAVFKSGSTQNLSIYFGVFKRLLPVDIFVDPILPLLFTFA